MPIKPHRSPNERIKLTHEKISEVKRGELFLCFLCERIHTFKNRITMRTWHHCNAQLITTFL